MYQLNQDYADRGKYFIAEHLTDNPFSYIINEIGFHAAWYKPAWSAATNQVLGQVGPGNLQLLRQLFETNHSGNPTTLIDNNTISLIPVHHFTFPVTHPESSQFPI